jgi:hypothetical protein
VSFWTWLYACASSCVPISTKTTESAGMRRNGIVREEAHSECSWEGWWWNGRKDQLRTAWAKSCYCGKPMTEARYFRKRGQLVEVVPRRVRNVLPSVAGREDGRVDPSGQKRAGRYRVERRLICKGIHHGVLRALQQAVESKVKRPAVARRWIRAFVSKACDGGHFLS